jgi:ABC-2 type transport system ATP-binding protein
MAGWKMIRLQSVSKSYNKGKVSAVDDLSLQVRPGEIFGFLGPNGAGKTTTIKLMVGLLRPDRGSIEVAGYDLQRQPMEVKRRLSYVPDNPEVYERLTGIEYLNFMADVHRVSAADRRRRYGQLLELFDLGSAIADPVKTYSHGMRQKLVLIGALVHEPRVFVLDEPMVGLDPRSAHHLKELMRQRCVQGNTVFFSTHVLEVAERLCDRIGIIHRGRLIACGTMDELRQQARDRESLEKIFLELTE